MDAGAESPAGRSAGGGIAMEFPAGNAEPLSSLMRLPRRLRQRLLNADCKSPVTVEEIETKLRDADLRREKYYEKVSSKARAKPRSPSRYSSQEEDLGQRLEAKLQAAEQNRLSILATAQMRLARLDELRKAVKTKIQRAEYLWQRGRLRGYARENWNSMPKQAEFLSRKLARYWRQFLSLKRTTFELAKAYDALGINNKSAKSMPFEQLALLIESASTLQTVKALLDRIESRLKVSREVAPANHLSSFDSIDYLLKRVAPPKKRASPMSFMGTREAKKVVSVRESWLSRYPLRVVLCAYMILGHPDVVFSGMGECEIALARCAQDFVQMFELLIKIILDGPIQCSDQESGSAVIKRCTFRSQLAAFDNAWCAYLNDFVVWKMKDAQSLEEIWSEQLASLRLL